MIRSLRPAALLCLTLACTPAPPPAPPEDPLLVETSAGPVQGLTLEAGPRAWLGVPFAAPPVGDARWRPPAPPAPWEEPLVADAQPPACLQPDSGATAGSEDCLYLNVFRPDSDEVLPVYVWIHGGANLTGRAADYPGEGLADALDAVVVIVQYRLGPLGFFRHPLLVDEADTPEGRSGNFGLLDVMAALEWVQREIPGFGGDATRVTVAGESAGAHNAMMLLTVPSAEELYDRLLLQSGGMWPRPAALAEVNAVAHALEVDPALTTAAELRALDPRALVLVTGAAAAVIEDGELIPTPLRCVLEGGVETPVLLGTNEDESKLFLPLFQFPAALDVLLNGASVDEALSERQRAMYPPIAEVASLGWRARYGDALAARLGPETWVYRYGFGRGDDVDEGYGFVLGAAHATEIPLFHAQPDLGQLQFTEANHAGRTALTQIITAAERAFVHDGDPATDAQPWPAYGAGDALLLDASRSEAEVSVERAPIDFDDVRAALAAVEDEETRAFAAAWTDTRDFPTCGATASLSPPVREVVVVNGPNNCFLDEGTETPLSLAPIAIGGDLVMVPAGASAAEGTFDGQTLRWRGLIPDGRGALAFEAELDWETGAGAFDYRYDSRALSCSGANTIEPR